MDDYDSLARPRINVGTELPGYCLNGLDLVFYADESGHSGAKHLDTQPNYVVGGWLLPVPNQERARAAVQHVLRETKMAELSGAQLVRTTAGRKATLRLLSDLMPLATQVVVVIEKRFALGIRLVSEFFDRTVNPKAGPEFTFDRPTMRATATIFATLPIDVLEIADDYTRDPSPAKAEECFDVIAPALVKQGHSALAATFLAARESLPGQWMRVDSVRQKGLSPNVLGFTTLLNMLELLGAASGARISLVHDEMRQLSQVYEFYQRFAAAQDLSQIFPELFNPVGLPGQIKHVSAPVFRDSTSELLVQAADFIAGMVSSLILRLERNGPWKGDEIPLAFITLAGFFNSDLRPTFSFIGSESMGMRVGQAVVDALDAWTAERDRKSRK